MPHDLTSLTKCFVRWIILSKNAGENIFSNIHKVLAISFCNWSNFDTSITFQHNELKNRHNLVMTYRTFFGKIDQIAIRNKCCLCIWKSWDLSPTNFNSFISTNALILEEYSSGIFTLNKHWHSTRFSSFVNAKHSGGK